MKTEDIEFDKLVVARLREKLGNGWYLADVTDEEILRVCKGTMLLATTRFGVAWNNLKYEIKQASLKNWKFSIFKA